MPGPPAPSPPRRDSRRAVAALPWITLLATGPGERATPTQAGQELPSCLRETSGGTSRIPSLVVGHRSDWRMRAITSHHLRTASLSSAAPRRKSLQDERRVYSCEPTAKASTNSRKPRPSRDQEGRRDWQQAKWNRSCCLSFRGGKWCTQAHSLSGREGTPSLRPGVGGGVCV